MKKYLNKIPICLIYSRLLLGFVVLALSLYPVPNGKFWIISIMIWAIVSDIFDGVIARSLNISTPKIRRLDSSVDQIFWICTLVGVFFICKDFFVANYIKLLLVSVLETLTYVVSFIKFRKEVATHAFLSKVWILSVFAVLIQIVISCQSSTLFNICIFLGVVSRIEIIAILLVLKKWTNDVPSIYHALLLRQGKEIKRHKLLNG